MKKIKGIMIGLLICVFLIMGSMAVWADQTGAVSGQTRVFDQAGLFSETEKIQLEEEIAQCRKNTKMDVVVVSAYADDRTAEEYADDYYDDNGYGYGENDSGILFLVAMDDREWNISTSGDAITAFTDAGLAYMEDQFVPDLSDGAYMDAFSKYASLCDDFLTRAENGEPYDTGHLPKKKVSPWWIAGDLLIGVIIAFVMALIKKTKLKSVKSQVTAGAYEKAGSLDLTVRTDHFVNRVVTTRKIERKQESGGSSVHTGSSGKSHGGRSGKF